ncbi:RidA family protein [Pseudomonas aeruginosa]|nr:RidA family protein [Pseudomonas aeruginosa]
MSVEQKLQELGLELPLLPKGSTSYKPYYIAGSLLFLSGQGPRGSDGQLRKGRLGDGYELEAGIADAQTIALQLLATAKVALGDLDRIVGVVRILGLVNSTPEFTEQPKVIDGCSKLFNEVLGDRGHARSAVGAIALPSGISVEIEAILEIK